MCESNVYLLENNKEELFLESVETIEVVGDNLRVRNILGEEKIISARIKRISLLEHKIILEKS